MSIPNKDYFCKDCKQNDVSCKGDLYWDAVTQSYKIIDPIDDSWYCHACNQKTSVTALTDHEWKLWTNRRA